MNQFNHALVTGAGALCVLTSAVAAAAPSVPTVSGTVALSAIRTTSISAVRNAVTTTSSPAVQTAFAPPSMEALKEASSEASSLPAATQNHIEPLMAATENTDTLVVRVLKQEHQLTSLNTGNTGEAELSYRNNNIDQQLRLRTKSSPVPVKNGVSPKNNTPRATELSHHTGNIRASAPRTSTSSVDPSSVHPSSNAPGAPSALIPVYQSAGARYGIPWTVLAAIHKTETDFRTSNCPESSAGAKGPMQFLPATFAEYAVKAPGQSGPPNIQNVDDSIYTAAHMLAVDGFSRSPSRAIFAYNHSNQYVKQVETTAGL